MRRDFGLESAVAADSRQKAPEAAGHTEAMGVSEEDRRRMERLGSDLRAIETDVPASPAALAAAVMEANRRRQTRGLPPLGDDSHRPEEEFYRRARALGLRRSRR